MKKLFLTAVIAVLGLVSANAQIEKGNSLISAAVGVGPTFAWSSADASLPLSLTYEYAVMDKLTVGAFGNYATAKYEGSGYDWKWTYFFVGAVGNYHFVNTEKFDVYAGARLGYIGVSFDDDGTGLPDPSSGGFGYTVQGGARYFFIKNLAVNAEVGYGFSIARLGLTLKL